MACENGETAQPIGIVARPGLTFAPNNCLRRSGNFDSFAIKSRVRFAPSRLARLLRRGRERFAGQLHPTEMRRHFLPLA